MLLDRVSIFNDVEVLKAFPKSGQKQVFLVVHPVYGKVVLKVVDHMDDRVQREIDLVNSNTIPGVPKIFDTGTFSCDDKDYFFYYEEYLDGETLKEVLKSRKLSVKETVEMMSDLLNAIVELEKLRVIHRDIKPENIILTSDGKFHLIDFGIARILDLTSLTLTNVQFGPHTPGYGAPETFRYDKSSIDSRADLFSLGVVAYESVFGEHPFVSGNEANVQEIWYKTETYATIDKTIKGDKSHQLFGFISTLMQKQPSKRPPSAATALKWFSSVLDTISIDEE